jgi:hypothetical protein
MTASAEWPAAGAARATGSPNAAPVAPPVPRSLAPPPVGAPAGPGTTKGGSPVTTAAAGSTTQAADPVLTANARSAEILVQRFTAIDLVSYFNKALAADNDLAFPAVANYRAQNDPVSLAGVHVAPVKVVQVDPSLRKLHRMATIVEALGGRVYSKGAAEIAESA